MENFILFIKMFFFDIYLLFVVFKKNKCLDFKNFQCEFDKFFNKIKKITFHIFYQKS